jgi:hypothetical protein
VQFLFKIKRLQKKPESVNFCLCIHLRLQQWSIQLLHRWYANVMAVLPEFLDEVQ